MPEAVTGSIPGAGHLFRYVTNQPPKANSAFHPSGVGKWVPASAGKAKAGMVHSVSGWTRGVQVKLWDPLRMRAIPERLRSVFTTRRCTNTRLPYLYHTSVHSSDVTRVGVTRGSNWWVSPHIFLKSDELFLAVVSSPLPSSHVVYPVFFLDSATNKNNFSRVSPSGWCHPGRSPLIRRSETKMATNPSTSTAFWYREFNNL